MFHQDYMNDLAYLTVEFASDVGRRKSKGRTLLSVIESGSEYDHFAFLRNGSIAAASLDGEERSLLSWGTCSNEALHAQLQSGLRVITQQHEDLVKVKI